MSFDAMNWASKQDCQNSTNKLILLMLANYSDEMGLVKKEGRYTPDGKQTSNRFILIRGDKTNMVGVTKTTPNTIRVIQKDYKEEFSLWWKTYPRKDGSKRKAFQLWTKIIKEEINHQKLLELTNIFKSSMSETDMKFIPHASTWLNQRRFETINEKKDTKKINLNTIAG